MAITNAQLAQQVSELMDYWRTRDLQFAEWLSGSPSGGPYGDGRYPLSDYLGVIQYLFCPAALESGVTSSASSAALSAALAGASKDEALLAQAAAEAARNQALTHRDDARAARDLALSYRDEAANHQANALTHRNIARDWASKVVDSIVADGLYSARHYATKASETYVNLSADLSAATNSAVAAATASATVSASAAAQSASDADEARSDAEAARDIALGHETNAANSAADAAASAAAAQTWNPANYLALAGGLMTGSLRSNAKIQTNGWAGDYMPGLGIAIGITSGKGYVHVYNPDTGTYGGLQLAGSTITTRVPLYVETFGTSALNRNTEFMTQGQPLVSFGSYNGQWRPSITIQGQTNAQYMFVVGPDSVDTTADTNARIHSSRGLILSTTNDYLYHQNLNGSVYFDPTGTVRKGYVYHDSTGFGLLGSTGGWAVRVPPGTNRVDIPANDIRSNYYYGLSDPAKYLGIGGGFTYGSVFVGGNTNGYVGLTLYDGVRNPALMSSGSARGFYCQSTSAWDWYCTDAAMYISATPYRASYGALLHFVNGQASGRIWVQQGGVAQGSQEGDITLIW